MREKERVGRERERGNPFRARNYSSRVVHVSVRWSSSISVCLRHDERDKRDRAGEREKEREGENVSVWESFYDFDNGHLRCHKPSSVKRAARVVAVVVVDVDVVVVVVVDVVVVLVRFIDSRNKTEKSFIRRRKVSEFRSEATVGDGD